MHATMVNRGSHVRTDHRPHVLLVDTLHECLIFLEKLFEERNFRVTKCQDSERCLVMIREKKQVFDLAIIEAQMPGIDGLKLTKLLREETIIPIILTSRDRELNVIRKGMEYGACDFFQKPISQEQVRAIDLDVLRARATKKVVFQGDIEEDSNNPLNPAANMDSSNLSRNSQNLSVADSGSVDSNLSVKREGDPINGFDQPPNKKPRVIWTEDLHAKFVTAVNMFGIAKAVPKKILEVMNVPNLTRENVASHLQKYRLYHKKQEEALQKPISTAVEQTHHAPDPIPMPTHPRLYDETNVNLYQNVVSSFVYGAEETAPPNTQPGYNNNVMLPENDINYESDPIIDWRQQIPPIGQPNILSHRSVNQAPMPGGAPFQPPINYAEDFVRNFDSSLRGYQGGGVDPLSQTQFNSNLLGYNDLAWQDPAVNMQPTTQQQPPRPPPPPSVYDYVPPNAFNQGGYDPTFRDNRFNQQRPNQATADDHLFFQGFPQDRPKFG